MMQRRLNRHIEHLARLEQLERFVLHELLVGFGVVLAQRQHDPRQRLVVLQLCSVRGVLLGVSCVLYCKVRSVTQFFTHTVPN